jgi:phosphoribosylformylglycinamidine synthase subunit PurSL
MNQALFDMSTYFNIPMTSGKDSMKNDFKSDNIKISVPPTILYSAVAKIADVRNTVTSDFKQQGDLIYQLGKTYDELGASEFYRINNETGANVPLVRKELAKALYLKVMEANDLKLIESSHDISDGGMLVALAECLIGTELGAEIDLSEFKDLSLRAILFSETQSRFVVSIKPENRNKFTTLLGDKAVYLGKVVSNNRLSVKNQHKEVVSLSVIKLQQAWESEYETKSRWKE